MNPGVCLVLFNGVSVKHGFNISNFVQQKK